jgi:Clostripain family
VVSLGKNGRKRDVLPPWGILVFMVGSPDLGPSIDRDLLELDRAGSNADVRVIVAVQKSARSATDFLEIQPLDSHSNPVKSKRIGRATKGDLDARLGAFLAFVAANCPARQYALILWAHASGLGFGRLGPGSTEDLIRLGELTPLLRSFRELRPEQPKLEILGFCACALSKAEFALELRDEVEFLVSSQVGISTLMTWPFDLIVQRALKSPLVPPETFAGQIVQSFEESYEPPPVALTAVDLKRSDLVKTQVDNVAVSILKSFDEAGDDGRLNRLCVLNAFRKALAAYPFELEPLVDFYDFCARLVDQDALAESVRQQARLVLNRGVRSVIVRNARSGPKLGTLNGLSILAPDFDDPDWLETYERCSPKAANAAWLWQSTRWVDMTKVVYEFATSERELLE